MKILIEKGVYLSVSGNQYVIGTIKKTVKDGVPTETFTNKYNEWFDTKAQALERYFDKKTKTSGATTWKELMLIEKENNRLLKLFIETLEGM